MLIELFLLVLLVTVVVLSMRRKPAVLDKPLVIESPGRYHLTLAPQLDRVQTFMERIAILFELECSKECDISGQFFEIREPEVNSQEGRCYLLGVSSRGGLLYFQAIYPQPLLRDTDSHLKQIREFSEAVLALHPLKQQVGSDEAAKLCRTVELAALKLNISAKPLIESS